MVVDKMGHDHLPGPASFAPIGTDKRRLAQSANPEGARQGCASCGALVRVYAEVMLVMTVARTGGDGGGCNDFSINTASPTTARNSRKNSANRISEMRLAMRDTFVRPSAPAISEMIRKMTAYLNIIEFLPRSVWQTIAAGPRGSRGYWRMTRKALA